MNLDLEGSSGVSQSSESLHFEYMDDEDTDMRKLNMQPNTEACLNEDYQLDKAGGESKPPPSHTSIQSHTPQGQSSNGAQRRSFCLASLSELQQTIQQF